jgi:hypothetical protein
MRWPKFACSHRPQLQQLETRFEVEHGVLWGFMNPHRAQV